MSNNRLHGHVPRSFSVLGKLDLSCNAIISKRILNIKVIHVLKVKAKRITDLEVLKRCQK